MKQVLLVELNEVNFDAIQYYISIGKLPTFGKLLEMHGLSHTTSEKEYEELEPWVQWVTAHTGRSLAEHTVFRLGDISKHDIPQIWEELEEQGITVAAMSPMNAKNRTKNAAFFVPDPWTQTHVTGSAFLKKVYGSVAIAVSRNAEGRMGASALIWLLLGAVRYAQTRNYKRYIGFAAAIRRNSWSKALILDLLIHDIFMSLMKKTQPGFASLFLNSAAHIQHHYMLSSPAYAGIGNNPAWYVKPGEDPLYDIYSLYDTMLSQLKCNFPNARLMLATGLHQEPHTETVFYWRLIHHDSFLKRIGIKFKFVEPLMSRDFIVKCADADEASSAEKRLSLATANGLPLFAVDNRGEDLFVMLTYPKEISKGFDFTIGAEKFESLEKHVAFVAIKNGMHDGTGYFLDTASTATAKTNVMPLKSLSKIIKASLVS
jgi:hypothetical protein